MIRKLFLALPLVCAFLLGWAFVGIERLIGDHEVGVVWEPFLKHRASLQMRFSDPSRQGLETVPFEDLNGEDRVRFIEFCEIRYGTRDPKKCYARAAARNV